MTAETQAFRALHRAGQPLVLPNAWDAASARLFVEVGFPAVATTSSAVAASLGYADGEHTPTEEMFAAVARIVRAVDAPVSADIEAGYRLEPAELVERLLATGVVGCNLDDSHPRSGEMKDPAAQADYLAAMRAAAGDALVINARIDVFLADRAGAAQTIDEAVARGRRYLEAGVDCTYPILAPADALPRLVGEIPGPVNVMHRSDGPSIAELAAVGVARISFGGGLHAQVMGSLREIAKHLRWSPMS